MSRRTQKVGPAGRYGPRYGVRVRRGLAAAVISASGKYECPRCKRVSLRRVSTGIWACRKCDFKMAGGAFRPQTASGVGRMTALRKVKEGSR